MLQKHGMLRASALIYLKWAASAAVLASAPLLGGTAASADEDRSSEARQEPPVRLLSTIPVPVAMTNTTGGMYGFDISFVDQSNQTYYLGDRSNASVDVVNARTGSS